MGATNWMRSSFTPGLASVIVPAYNRAELLIETLDSVKAQTYRPIELIVVDDGSEDDTAARVEEWRTNNQDKQFTVLFEQQSNQGANAARNRGLEVCSGEYIQLLDSDDLIHPDKLSTSIRCMKERHARAVVAHVFRFRDRSEIEELWSKSENFRPHAQEPTRLPYITRLRWDGVIPLYTRSIVDELGPFDLDVGLSGSAEYAFRVKLSASPIYYAPYVLYYYRRGVEVAATRSSISRVTKSKLKLLEVMSKELASRGIEEKAEWRELTTAALIAAYRADVVGDLRDEFLEALALARKSASRWNTLASFCLSIPPLVILSGMRVRYWLLAGVRRPAVRSRPAEDK